MAASKKTTGSGKENTGRKAAEKTVKTASKAAEKKVKTESKATEKKVKTASKTAGKGGKSSGTAKQSRKGQINVPDISRPSGTPIFAEVILWVMLAFCIILFLSNVFGLGGKAGGWVSGFLFGVFGLPAYVFPIVLFLLTAFVIANRGVWKAWVKVLAAVLMLLTISCFSEMFSGQIDSARTLADYYAAGYELRSGGGLAGGLLCSLFYPVFGLIGTWICAAVLFLISILALTGYSLFDSLREEGSNAIGSARKKKNMKQELHRQKRRNQRLQEQIQMRREIEDIRSENDGLQQEIHVPRRLHVVTGVSMDTTFDESTPATQEVHEVIPRLSGKTPGAVKRQRKGELRQDYSSFQEEPKDQEKEAEFRKAGEERSGNIPEKESDSRAHHMVESVDENQKSSQMKMQFTIQRNGTSRTVENGTSRMVENVSSQAPVTRLELTPETIPDEQPAEEALKEKTEKVSRSRTKSPSSSREEQQAALQSVAEEIQMQEAEARPKYVFPPLELLTQPDGSSNGNSDSEVRETAAKLQQTLHNFGVNVTVTNVSCGPSVTRYELMPEQGVKVSRIVNLADDIKLNLAAADIRIEAPIPGKPAVGIEVPNKENSAVYLRELLESEEFKKASSPLSFAVGKDIAGKTVVTDIAKMPHLLIAGATGSGKSVCINTLIMSILYKADPEDVKLIMIDPKVVELSVYNGIPHLFIPVVTDPKKASGALNWAVAEMDDRYRKFAETGVRDLKGYNKRIAALEDVEDPNKPKKLPQIVIIVDELADLMMVAPGEVEDSICRLAQLARAAGIHLIIATQRPSVNVITGLIKANMPSRIAFSVTSGVDSRTILDMVGAEKLLGKGDMLFYPQGYPKPVRVQGSFVSDAEVSSVADFLIKNNDTKALHQEMENRMSQVSKAASVSSPGAGENSGLDSNFVEAGKFIIEKDKASIGMLQRVFKIGFNRAARIMDQLAEAGVVGPEEGTKPRKILMTMEEFEQYIDESV